MKTWTAARARVVFALGIAAIATLVAAGTVTGSTGSVGKAKAGPIVAFLLPENVTPRWEGSDAPTFKTALAKLVPGAQVDVLNALNDSSKQQAQAEAELTKGAKVLVIAAVDQKAAAVIVNKAHSQGVPVIAYDRLIKSSPLAYYVSFDSVAVGKAEASWMAKHTKQGARLVIINGSPTDDNAHLVYQGIHSVLNPLFASGKRVKVAEQWTPGWDPTKAQTEMEQILTKANNGVDGVVSANDGMSGGIIAALKAQSMQGTVKTTGQDASLEGVQNVIIGNQGVTVFKDFRLQAPAAAKITAAILNGTKPTIINAYVSNGMVKVPSVMLKVVPVDQSNISLLVKNGWIKSQFGGLAKVCQGLPKVSICS
ncbi:MAG TPA: sugar ABC transporter substrate-binding protein [Gaiellaceae bacterium]|nr:sugar ABC transporter substrate-binding protein [Gaiellaceae bacterium]